MQKIIPSQLLALRLRLANVKRRVISKAKHEFSNFQHRRKNVALRKSLQDVRKVHVGCGRHNHFEGWYNVDIQSFPGVDLALDVTKSWPFANLDYVYSEHFLEHLSLLDGVKFLYNTAQSLRPGGKLRVSTPNLSWVMATHFPLQGNAETKIHRTMATNRAFHAWGHQFLYTSELLELILREVGFEESWSCTYGQSNDPSLHDLERHGGFYIQQGEPSVVILEARKGSQNIGWPTDLEALLREKYIRYVETF